MVCEEFMENEIFDQITIFSSSKDVFSSNFTKVARTQPALKAVKKMAAGKKVLAKKVRLQNMPNLIEI